MNKRYYNILVFIFAVGYIITDWVLPNWGIHIFSEFLVAFLLVVATLEWLGVSWSVVQHYRGTQVAREFQKGIAKLLALLGVSILILEFVVYLYPSVVVAIIGVIFWLTFFLFTIVKVEKWINKYSELMKLEVEENKTSRWIY